MMSVLSAGEPAVVTADVNDPYEPSSRSIFVARGGLSALRVLARYGGREASRDYRGVLNQYALFKLRNGYRRKAEIKTRRMSFL